MKVKDKMHLRKYNLVKELSIHEGEVASIKTNKHRENMEYLDMNMNLLFEKFKENLKNDIGRLVIRKADVPYSRYIQEDGENIWVQRRYDLLKEYICAAWTTLGYKCLVGDTEITIIL